MNALKGLVLATLLAAPAALAQDTLTGYTGQVTLQGSITGATTATIRVYNNGLVAASGASDVTGQYSISFPSPASATRRSSCGSSPTSPAWSPRS